MKKKSIQVRAYGEGQSQYGSAELPGTDQGLFADMGTILRRVYVDQVGNFNRCACRYKGRTFLVQSDAGDLGDPFRADESYATSLFIDAGKPCAWSL